MKETDKLTLKPIPRNYPCTEIIHCCPNKVREIDIGEWYNKNCEPIKNYLGYVSKTNPLLTNEFEKIFINYIN